MSTSGQGYESDLPKIFGETVRKLRKAQHISIYVLAARSGLSVNYISSIELGKRDVSFSTIRAIADALGVPMRDLFGLPKEIPASAVEAARLFEAASPEWREAILEILLYEPTSDKKGENSA